MKSLAKSYNVIACSISEVRAIKEEASNNDIKELVHGIEGQLKSLQSAIENTIYLSKDKYDKL